MADESRDIVIQSGPYSGIDYSTTEKESQRKALSELGSQMLSSEQAANVAYEKAVGAQLQPVVESQPLQEPPFLPDGTENPNFRWDGPPQEDIVKPSFAEAQDIEARKKAELIAQANQQAAEEQARLQEQATKEMAEWKKRVMADADDLAKVTDPRFLLADPRDNAPRRWLTSLLVGLSSGANVLAGGTGESALMRQINADLDRDMERKKLALEAVIQRARTSGAKTEDILKMQQRGAERIEATRQALIQKFEADAAAALSAYPQHQQAAAIELAKLAQSNARRMSDLAMQHTGNVLSSKVTSVSGDKGGSQLHARMIPTVDEVERYSRVKESQDFARRLEELTEKGSVPSPAQYKEYFNNKRKFAEKTRKKEAGIGGEAVVEIGEMLGVYPESVYPQSLVPNKNDSKEVAQKKAEIREFLDKAHLLSVRTVTDQFGEEAISKPSGKIDYLAPIAPGVGGGTKEDIVRKTKDLVNLWKQSGAIAEQASRTGVTMRTVGAQPPSLPTQQPQPQSGYGLAQKLARVPESLRAKIVEALRSKDAKAKAAAAEFLRKLGAEQ